MRCQVLDTAGVVREQVEWPLPIHGPFPWQELPHGETEAVFSGDLAGGRIAELRLSGKTATVAAAQTMFSAFPPDAIAALWLGLRGPKQTLTVIVQREPGRSPIYWLGPDLVSTDSFGSSPQPSSDCRPKLMKDFGGAEILYRACLSWVKIGPAIETLELEAPGLGAAFYWTLTYAIYRAMRIYNHDDAFEYEERMKEYAEEVDNPEQYEFPEVEKALPECIGNTLEGKSRLYAVQARKLLSRHRNGKYGSWIERLRNIERLSRVRLPSDASFREDGGYDTIPLPSLVVAFKEHDAIVACFDEESQHMLEGSAEPAFCAVFTVDNPEECSSAMRAAERFVLVNRELCELIEAIQALCCH